MLVAVFQHVDGRPKVRTGTETTSYARLVSSLMPRLTKKRNSLDLRNEEGEEGEFGVMKESCPRCTSNQHKFHVVCEAGNAGNFDVYTRALSVHIGQTVCREEPTEMGMWDSVVVHCWEEKDGSLCVDVMVFHPLWEGGRKVAHLKSHPQSKGNNLPVLISDLEPRPIY
jgi:hypothetical protein